jgi:DNA-binding transcriptional ArsR family regulator
MNWERGVRPLPEDPNQALLDVLKHPLRRLLLKHYVEAAGMLSPKELAVQTRQPLSSVGYHVRKLAKAGAVVLASERQVRGAVQHFYRATPAVRETPWVLATLGLSGDKREET